MRVSSDNEMHFKIPGSKSVKQPTNLSYIDKIINETEVIAYAVYLKSEA